MIETLKKLKESQNRIEMKHLIRTAIDEGLQEEIFHLKEGSKENPVLFVNVMLKEKFIHAFEFYLICKQSNFPNTCQTPFDSFFAIISTRIEYMDILETFCLILDYMETREDYEEMYGRLIGFQ